MKKILLLSIILISISSFGQNNIETAFDFWVGNWEAKWLKPDSSFQFGTNQISKVLDGKVIEENFQSPDQNFKGKSLSVYNPNKKTWHQAWADNQGSYYDFLGIIEPNRKIFTTDTSKTIIQRMVFHKIEQDSFIWDWETSKDGGKTYQLTWQIFYSRAN
jgi:hypothetical protein